LHWRYYYKSDGLLYNILERFCLLAQHVCFRRIETFGKENMPVDSPLLIVANHPTAFMDPILLATLLDEPMYHMTRGDIFEKPLASKLLYSMNMFPVYRARDGYGSSRRNTKVFDYVFEQLKKRKTIVIFVEGQHHLDVGLKPLQKGAAAIAQYAYANLPELRDLQILPVGFNYLYGDQKWDDVSVTFGKPFYAKDYLSKEIVDHDRDMETTDGDLMSRIQSDLLELVHHLTDQNDQRLFALGKEMIRTDQSKSSIVPQIKQHTRVTFDQERIIMHRLNTMLNTEKLPMRAAVREYTKSLKAYQITDASVANPRIKMREVVWLFLFFVPFLVGYIGAMPLRFFTNYLVKNKVKKREFHTSVHLGGGILIGILWYIPLAVLAIFSKQPYTIALALSLPLLGWFVSVYLYRLNSVKYAFRAKNLSNLTDLQTKRTFLKESIWPQSSQL
jgi:glycerol-3-phosphate O-acyltransferase / dihydroxyacetone phosphate acyltransferase